MEPVLWFFPSYLEGFPRKVGVHYCLLFTVGYLSYNDYESVFLTLSKRTLSTLLPYFSKLNFNWVSCLEDWDIPWHLEFSNGSERFLGYVPRDQRPSSRDANELPLSASVPFESIDIEDQH